MSSRAIRRLQKEQEHQNVIEHDEDAEERINLEPRQPNDINVFDMLNGADNEDLGSEDVPSDSDDKNVDSAKNSEEVGPLSSKTKGKKKKKKGKNKNKANTQPNNNESSQSQAQPDEIDVALQLLSTKDRDGSYAVSNIKTNNEVLQMWQLLGVDLKQLNALNEMKRLFGNVVIEGDNDDPVTTGQGRRRARGPQQLDLGGALAGRNSPVSKGQGLAGLALRRNVFMMGKEEWPKATSGGLAMDVVEKLDMGTTEYRFMHNTAYQDVQRQFEVCVASMEPQRMIQMLQFNPYHISTLLQVSEIAKQQGDHSVSGDLLERALFSFGRSVHSSFATALSEGKARLDFTRPENREFWLAAWRYISNLGQRGTWRTAYEWAKLLLSLSPEDDPYRVSLILDQLALRGGQGDHLLQISQNSYYHEKWGNYPNIHISSALAEHKAKQATKCRLLLAEAVKKYPWIFARLFGELNIEPIPKSIWGKEPRSEREKLECEIYVSGAKDLWSNPDATSFLMEVTGSVTVDESSPIRNEDITIDEARHVLLMGTPALISLIPRTFTRTSFSSLDPLPPAENKTSYTLTPITDQDISHPSHYDSSPLRDQPDLPIPEAQGSDAQEIRRLQSLFVSMLSAIAPSLVDETTDQGPSDRPTSTPQQQLTDLASTPGPFQTAIATRGIRLVELLRRSLGRDPNPEDIFSSVDTTTTTTTTTTGPSPTEPPSPSPAEPSSPTPPSPSSSSSSSSNDDLTQRWLAGQGLIRLRDFTILHGTDEAAWPRDNPAIADEGRQLFSEYARRVGQLRNLQTRRFILEYVLPQGAGREVRDLVGRFEEGEREGRG